MGPLQLERKDVITAVTGNSDSMSGNATLPGLNYEKLIPVAVNIALFNESGSSLIAQGEGNRIARQ
jgi:hypothetical protein